MNKKIFGPIAFLSFLNLIIGWFANRDMDAKEKAIKDEVNLFVNEPNWGYILEHMDNWAETIDRDPDGFWTP